MGQVWSWQGQLSRVQWQALGSLGSKLQPLGKGWKKLKQSVRSPPQQTKGNTSWA